MNNKVPPSAIRDGFAAVSVRTKDAQWKEVYRVSRESGISIRDLFHNTIAGLPSNFVARATPLKRTDKTTRNCVHLSVEDIQKLNAIAGSRSRSAVLRTIVDGIIKKHAMYKPETQDDKIKFIDKSVEWISERVDAVSKRIDGLGKRVDIIEKRPRNTLPDVIQLANIKRELAEVKADLNDRGYRKTQEKISRLNERVFSQKRTPAWKRAILHACHVGLTVLAVFGVLYLVQ